ncbi:ABC transporter ATP-binding protein [Microterricola viridarii]|uniref:ABC-type multidrug transport system, ATPase component n=1 Tax=Microterricola viridarii TaxID=412690 RepID=A0A1H1XRF6_9MICO|nr:ABC transporter ATP-binding protein [Microterricola viridarii]SDT11743.1 ABC-type multidrug transport system, ATPase component [Microterricola viridarii]
MSAAPVGISVSGVSRSFGAVHAVRDASLEVRPGSVTGLIGPNGSGKTTLLLMLATLLQPDAGSIRIAGFDPIGDTTEVRARMGWMPDVLGAWPTLTVRQAVETTGRLYRMPQEQAARRTEELLAITGLTALAGQSTRVLSRGQKQRLSLARALVHDPAVLLLDEPASGLDPAARADLRTLVRRLAGEGTAILVSSHVLSELDEMADAAVYMSAGVTASAEEVARAQSSLRQWRVRALDRAVLASAIATIGMPAERVALDNVGALLSFTDEAEAAAALGRLVGAGAAISDFGPAVGVMEHTFLDLNRDVNRPQPLPTEGGSAA